MRADCFPGKHIVPQFMPGIMPLFGLERNGSTAAQVLAWRLFCTGRASTAFGNCLKRFGDRLAFPIHFFLAAVAFLISAAAVFANLGTRQAISRIMANLKRHPGKWLRSAARRMVKVTIKDWKEWKRAHG